MLEQDWLAAADAEPMLEFLRESASERKLRLFAAACCRQLWALLNQSTRSCVETAERFADGRATRHELAFARQHAERFAAALPVRLDPNSIPGWRDPSRLRLIIRDAVRAAVQPQLRPTYPPPVSQPAAGWPAVTARGMVMAVGIRVAEGADTEETWALDTRLAMRDMRARQAALVRDIFGNPFNEVPFAATWRTPGVTAVAQSLYKEGRFADLPILADALEEAGCTDPSVLNHCRKGSDHVRGCWVVDSALAKD